MNILIVEDNEINAKVLEIMLKDLQYQFNLSIAHNADEALSATGASQYDLILMDINLGDGSMDGVEVMKKLRESESYYSTPIYAVTCYSLPGDKERFLKAGFDKYFSKPVDQKQLLSEINIDFEKKINQ